MVYNLEAMKKIAVAIDNSSISPAVARAALDVAKVFGSEVIGVHGYNVRLHERAFRIMEPILPQKYQEQFLAKQREFHDELMRSAMERISLSYLEPYREMFEKAGVPYRCAVREGKNYSAVLGVATEESADLIVVGAYGFNRVREGYLGSTCLRVMRAFPGRILVVRDRIRFEKIVVALDGSEQSLGVLRTALRFAESFDAELHLLYVFDTNLHRFIFDKLKRFMFHVKGFSFKSKEQERLHDEFIDKGLRRVGELIIEKGMKVVQESGFGGRVVPAVIEGYLYDGVCHYMSQTGADLVFLGRTGRHYEEGMDIGSVAENVARYAPGSVFLGESGGTSGWRI